MTGEVFIDTNILLYAGSKAESDKEKCKKAEQILSQNNFVLSTQVIHEYIANVLKKKSLGLTEKHIDALLQLSLDRPVVDITVELLIVATKVRRRYQVSTWDAAIVASALEAGCSVIYSEDLNDRQSYEGVRVVNPFL